MSAGDTIGFTITVSNGGAGTATGVEVSDPLPTNDGLNWSINGGANAGLFEIALVDGVRTLRTKTAQTLAPNATLVVDISSPTTSATAGTGSATVSNTASVTTTNDGSDQSTATVTVLGADIDIAKTADAASVSAGDTIGFTITVSNAGPGTATGVEVSDPLPTNVGLSWSIDATNSDTDFAIDNGTLRATFASLASGASKRVHITSPTTGATAGTGSATVSNTASVTTTNDGSDQSTAAVTVQAAALSITKVADEETVSVGSRIGFTITVSNAGPGTATSVQVSDPLPSGTGIDWSIANQPDGNHCSIAVAAGSETLTCNFGDLAASASRTVYVTSETTSGSKGTYENTATVTSSNHDTREATATITVKSFRIITLVCEENTNKLHASTVTVDGETKTSLPAGSAAESLCTAATNGATYTNQATGDHPSNVNIPLSPVVVP